MKKTIYNSESFLSQSSTANLARLMAQEDIKVVFSSTDETASFNIVDRVLTLPLYNGLTDNEVQLFVAHEISHASNTGKEYLEYAEQLKKKYNLAESSVATVMNIVEDVRIEKLVKRRYPGLKKDFYFGYKDLNERFNSKDGGASKSKGFVERFNHHFKFGHFLPTNFSAEEQSIVDMADDVETLEDVFNIADRLVQHYKDNNQIKTIPSMAGGVGNGSEENAIPFSGEDMGFIEWGTTPANSTTSGGKSVQVGKKTLQPANESSKTSNDETLKGTVNDPQKYDHSAGKQNVYVDLPVISNVDQLILPVDKIRHNTPSHMANECDAFVTRIRPLVSLLASIFNRKKQATEYRRALEHKSGTIDPGLLTKYKFVDKIFKSFKTVRTGKKHGLVMYIDWSGSMSGTIHATMKQAIIVMELCKRINIPFELFAFSDESDVSTSAKVKNYDSRTTAHVSNFRLLQFMSSSLSAAKYKESLRRAWSISSSPSSSGYDMGGTPLNEAMYHAFNYLPVFKERTKSDIVSMVVLSDGDASRPVTSACTSTRKPILRHQYSTYKANMDAGTDAIVRAIRDVHKVNTVCFYITNGTGNVKTATTLEDRQGYNERIFIPNSTMNSLTFSSDIQKDIKGKAILDRFITLIAAKYESK